MITLYNYYQNKDSGKEEWRRTVLGGERRPGKPAVYWQESKGANVIQSGLSTADGVLVLIWFGVDAEGRKYVPPKVYAALSPAEAAQHWTLTPGRDRIIRGVVPDGMAVKDAVAAYDDCITVTSVDTWDAGSRAMCHWEVSGK